MTSLNVTAPPIPAPRRRILLVEDHRAMREAVTELLQTDDELDVLAAVESAEEALELIAAHQPVDLAVVDLNLPGMHGLQLVAELDRRAHIPVIVLSSHSSERYGPVALDAGARAYVEKIRTAAELIGTVRQVLDLPGNGHAACRRSGNGANGHAFQAANGNERPSPSGELDGDARRPLDDGFDGLTTH